MKNKKSKKINVIIFFIVAFLVCFLLSSYLIFNTKYNIQGTNYSFHNLRIKGIWWSLENHIFPHRINALANDFKGDADPIGYPYLFLYIPGFLLKYLNYEISFNIYIMLVNIFTFIIMFISSNTIFKNNFSAIISSIFWTLCNYRLYDIYDFCRVGEYTALIFYPMAIAGIYNIFFDDRKKWYYLIIAMTGVLQSHIISFYYLLIMTIFLVFISFIINIFICLKNKNFVILLKKSFDFLKAGIISILINLWFIVPFLHYFFENSLNFSTMGDVGLASNTLSLDCLEIINENLFINKLVDLFNNCINKIISYDSIKYLIFNIKNTNYGDLGKNISFSDKVAFLFIYIMIIFIILKFFLNKEKKFDKLFIVSFLFFIIYIYYYNASLGRMLIQTQKIKFLYDIYGKQQFSFRELGRGLPFLALAFGYFVSKIKINPIVSFSFVIFITSISAYSYLNTKSISNDVTYSNNMYSIQSLSDYQFKTMNDDNVKNDFLNEYSNYNLVSIYDDVYSTSNHIKVVDYIQGYLSIFMKYEYSDVPLSYKYKKKDNLIINNCANDDMVNDNSIKDIIDNCSNKIYIELPMFAYTGFECYDNNHNKLPIYRNIHGNAVIEVNKFNGSIKFMFKEPIIWSFSSLLSYLLILYFVFKRCKYEIYQVKNYFIEEG